MIRSISFIILITALLTGRGVGQGWEERVQVSVLLKLVGRDMKRNDGGLVEIWRSWDMWWWGMEVEFSML